MTGLYILIKYLTFPGALIRGFWEQVVCRICKVPVEDNRYLRKDEMCSHIEHEFMPKTRGAFALCFVPAFMNAIAALFLAIIPGFIVMYLQIGDIYLKNFGALSYWFAVSLFVNSYPLIEDALNMMDRVYKHGNILQKIFYTPGAIFLYIGAYLEKYCITFLVAVVGTVIILVA